MSTDTTNFRAFIYSSPTVVDLDGDGYLDILVGTSYGLFYVLDHHGNAWSLLLYYPLILKMFFICFYTVFIDFLWDFGLLLNS